MKSLLIRFKSPQIEFKAASIKKLLVHIAGEKFVTEIRERKNLPDSMQKGLGKTWFEYAIHSDAVQWGPIEIDVKQDPKQISPSILLSSFINTNPTPERKKIFLEEIFGLTLKIYFATLPEYVYGGEENSYFGATGEGRKQLFWLNIIGHTTVKKFGENVFLSIPCYKVQKLSDGGILILLSEHPYDLEEYDRNYQRANKHLGKEILEKLPMFD